MNDEQKVIKGLQCCQNIDVICMDIHCFEPGFSECPYHGQDNCVSELCKDTLKLLQKQKRVGMPRQEEDRGTVIEGLEKVWDAFNHMEHELYADYVFDALAMLKEQENASKRNPVIVCPHCGKRVK